MSPEEVFSYFNIGEAATWQSIGHGHIHDTFKIITKDKAFLLQKINHSVFGNVPGMMSNIELVLNHLNSSHYSYETLKLLKVEGKNFLKLGEAYWRIYDFKEGSTAVEKADSSETVYHAALAFGAFDHGLLTLRQDKLIETIPRFHDLSHRLALLEEAARDKKKTGLLWELIDSLYREMLSYDGLLKSTRTPKIITHNDTKINNVLFKENKASCVIDLDTVMPGVAAYDFGDGIRTCTSSLAEDEEDLSSLEINLEFYEAFAQGFNDGFSDLSNEERKAMTLSGVYMAYMMGIRFTTDYLLGNRYYKVAYEDQNYHRALNQFTLAQRLYDLKGEALKFI
jgi:Ser/Thr protein kinase RdoA (MazF antagonist)